MRRPYGVKGFLLLCLLLTGAVTSAAIPSARAAEYAPQVFLADFSKRSYCLRYTKLAIAAQQQNMRDRCGYKGHGWSDDVQGHTRRCLAAPVERSRAETATRQNAILSCAARTKTGYCAQYLRMASIAFFRNDEDRCGLEGAHWRRRGAALKNWCLRVPRNRSTAAAQMRAQDLANCARSRRKDD